MKGLLFVECGFQFGCHRVGKFFSCFLHLPCGARFKLPPGWYGSTVAESCIAACCSRIQKAKDESTVSTFITHQLLCPCTSRHSVASSLSRLECPWRLIVGCPSACPSSVQYAHRTSEYPLIYCRLHCLVCIAWVVRDAALGSLGLLTVCQASRALPSVLQVLCSLSCFFMCVSIHLCNLFASVSLWLSRVALFISRCVFI